MSYNAEKKILFRYMSGKKFLTPERLGKKILPQTLETLEKIFRNSHAGAFLN